MHSDASRQPQHSDIWRGGRVLRHFTLARAETAGLTLRCAENGGWHAPLRFDLRRPRVVAKWNPCLLLALIPDQLSNDTRAPVLKSPFHGHRGEYLWKISTESSGQQRSRAGTFLLGGCVKVEGEAREILAESAQLAGGRAALLCGSDGRNFPGSLGRLGSVRL